MTVNGLLLTGGKSTTSYIAVEDEKKKIDIASTSNPNATTNNAQAVGVPILGAITVQKEEPSIRSQIDIDEYAKKYKKNRTEVFDNVGMQFSEEQKKELKKYVKDQKSLEAFLGFVQFENLSEADIVAGMAEFVNLKASQKKGFLGLLSRAVNTGKLAVTEGISEAAQYAKSEILYIATKLSKNMDEAREERKDLSPDAVATIGRTETEHPELKEDIVHFVIKQNQDGSSLYKEEDILIVVDYATTNGKEKADELTNNAVELESITTPEGQIKFKGETIINVSIKETEHPEIQAATRAVANKSDVNDETLVYVTDNLSQNPDMADVVEYEATAKTEDGQDRFSAQDITDTTTQLVDKDQETCQNYTNDVKRMSENKNLTGSQIVELERLANENPSQREAIITRACNSSYKSNDIVTECKNYVAQAKNNTGTDDRISSNSSSYGTAQPEPKTTTEISITPKATNPITAPKQESERTVTVDGKTYNRSQILSDLTKQFGSSNAETVLQAMERNTKFIQLLKEYGNKKELRDAIVSDPQIVTKLQNLSASITIKDLADMISICKNSTITSALIMLSDIVSPQKALIYLKAPGTADKIMPILENSTISKSQKMELINNITGRS